jgi:DNA-binding transcriptional MerR regulator
VVETSHQPKRSKDNPSDQESDAHLGSFLSLDSGLHSRLYDSVMATNHQAASATMQIGEVAKRTSLTADAIRFYEKRRLLPKAVRSAGRFRLYGASTVERLHFIQQMQGLGFSLREVGELIRLRERKVDACESVKEFLKAKLIDVRAKLQELRHLESELETDLRKCNRELNHRRRHTACACPVLEDVAGVSQ